MGVKSMPKELGNLIQEISIQTESLLKNELELRDRINKFLADTIVDEEMFGLVWAFGKLVLGAIEANRRLLNYIKSLGLAKH